VEAQAALVAAFELSEDASARVHRLACPCHGYGAVGLQIEQNGEGTGHQHVAVSMDVRDALLLADRLVYAAHLAMQPAPEFGAAELSGEDQSWMQDVRIGVVPDPAPFYQPYPADELAESFDGICQN
jgi:hypothetical protein